MFTIVLASRKGGGGKTTLASHLSVEAERAGFGPVAVIDLDPMGGLSGWWDARKAKTPALSHVGKGGLSTTLAALRDGGFQTVFIDTPPSVGAEVAEAIAVSDLVLVPCKPSPDDLRAVRRPHEARKQWAEIAACLDSGLLKGHRERAKCVGGRRASRTEDTPDRSRGSIHRSINQSNREPRSMRRVIPDCSVPRSSGRTAWCL